MSETIGFIGLGHLGLPMATNLLNAGYRLRVYNRTTSKAEALVREGTHLASRPVDAVTSEGIVVTVLWDDEAVESIVMSPGFLKQLGSGGIHLSMSTISPALAKKLAAIHTQHGSVYVEAPIFGPPQTAVAQQLWMPVAGPQPAKERVQPLLKAMGAQGLVDFGEEVGAATLVKLIGNFLIVTAGYALREALSVAEENGVDPKAVLEMMTQTPMLFPSPIYQRHGKRIVENPKAAPFGQSKIPLKDINLFKTTAQQRESPTPVASLLSDLMRSNEGRA